MSVPFLTVSVITLSEISMSSFDAAAKTGAVVKPEAGIAAFERNAVPKIRPDARTAPAIHEIRCFFIKLPLSKISDVLVDC